jgi:hypothetical protein
MVVLAESSKARTKDRIIELRGWPGGPALGKIYPKVPLRKSDKERGEWVRVRLSGWVKKADLTGASEASTKLSPKAAITPTPVAPVELVGFEIREAKRDILGQPNAVIFDLKVKNISGSKVAGWKGILVIQDQQGKVLARTLATHDNANLEPEAQGEVSFFWEKGDASYLKLMEADRGSLEVSLHQIQGL